ARIAPAVLLDVGVVGVVGAEHVLDLVVVVGTLVGVLDQQRDRRAGGAALVDAGEDLHRVGFLALRDVARSARLAPVQVRLDVGFAQLEVGGAAVDDAADGGAVALAEAGDAEQLADGIAGHESSRCSLVKNKASRAWTRGSAAGAGGARRSSRPLRLLASSP